MKGVLWAGLAVLLISSAAWAAAPAKPAASAPPNPFAQNIRDFERNTALGAALSMRPGTAGELKELQALADRGLRAAEEAVAKYPDKAQAHYLLGSWLLYAYRVREVRQVTVRPGQAASGTATQVVQGLKEDVELGLATLKRATALEPDNGRYVIDYGAALLDCDRLSEAMGYLKSAWAGKPKLTPPVKLEIALLLSRVYEAQGALDDARDWVYSGLEANPENAALVQHLRWLDKALPEAEAEAAEAERLAQEEAERLAEEEAARAEAEAAAEEGEGVGSEATRKPSAGAVTPSVERPPVSPPTGPSDRQSEAARAGQAAAQAPVMPLDRNRRAPAGAIGNCPFDLAVGSGIRLAQRSGEMAIRFHNVDYRAGTLTRMDVSRWSIVGTGGAALTVEAKQGSGSQLASAETVILAGSYLQEKGTADQDFIWRGQGFEVYLDGALVGAFSNTAEYTAARGG